MLSKKQKQKITNNLPYGYAKKVVDILNRNGKTNANGKSYSETSVRQVLVDRENLDIEEALLELYEETISKKQNLKSKAKKTLKSA